MARILITLLVILTAAQAERQPAPQQEAGDRSRLLCMRVNIFLALAYTSEIQQTATPTGPQGTLGKLAFSEIFYYFFDF